MKVTIERKEFLDLLSVGGSMAGKSKTMPILNCVKVTIKGKYVTASSYDGENAITKRMESLNDNEDCVFCVNYKDITNILKVIKDSSVSIDVDDKILTIKHTKGELTIPTENVDDFPSPIKENDTLHIDMKSEDLFNLLNVARKFVASDTLKPQMCCVQLVFEDGFLTAAASDGQIMFLDSMKHESEGKVECLVGSSSINPLLSMINGTEYVTMMIGERNTYFRTSDAMLICRQTTQKFPNCKAVLPKSHSLDLSIDKSDFVESIDRTMVTSNESSLVRMQASGMNLELSSEDIDFSKKSKELCMCTCNGEITIGVKGTLLKTCLESIDSDVVNLEMNTEKSPILIKDSNNPYRTILLMPMLLN